MWGLGAGASLILGLNYWDFFGSLLGILTMVGSGWFWTRRERLQFRDGAHLAFDPVLDNGVYWSGVAIGLGLMNHLLT